jgi:hypothetical protein
MHTPSAAPVHKLNMLARVSQGKKPVAELIHEGVTRAHGLGCASAAVNLVEQVLKEIVWSEPFLLHPFNPVAARDVPTVLLEAMQLLGWGKESALVAHAGQPCILRAEEVWGLRATEGTSLGLGEGVYLVMDYVTVKTVREVCSLIKEDVGGKVMDKLFARSATRLVEELANTEIVALGYCGETASSIIRRTNQEMGNKEQLTSRIDCHIKQLLGRQQKRIVYCVCTGEELTKLSVILEKQYGMRYVPTELRKGVIEPLIAGLTGTQARKGGRQGGPTGGWRGASSSTACNLWVNRLSEHLGISRDELLGNDEIKACDHLEEEPGLWALLTTIVSERTFAQRTPSSRQQDHTVSVGDLLSAIQKDCAATLHIRNEAGAIVRTIRGKEALSRKGTKGGTCSLTRKNSGNRKCMHESHHLHTYAASVANRLLELPSPLFCERSPTRNH